MIIPFKYYCKKCVTEKWININQEEQSFHYECVCGTEGDVFLSQDYTIGVKILYKSQYELEVNKDYSLSIVLSATAFECELSRLYFKWTEIDRNEQGEEISNDKLEEMLWKVGAMNTKIENVAKLMNPEGIGDFVRKSIEFFEIISIGFPSLDINNLSKSFQKNLFWPRNRILHLGYSNYNEDDAIRCLRISSLGIELFNEMDESRRNSRK